MNEIQYNKDNLPLDIDNLITHFDDSILLSYIPQGEEGTFYTTKMISETGELEEEHPRISFSSFEDNRIKKVYSPNGLCIFFHSKKIATIDTGDLQDLFIKEIQLKDPDVATYKEGAYVFLNQILFRVFGIPDNHSAVLLYTGIQQVSDIITPEKILDCFRKVVEANFS